MFSRNLTKKEIETIGIMENFLREKHAQNTAHDYSHVLEVARRAIEIAERLSEPVDPFILICGALFHDLGRVGALTGAMHGVRGAALAEQFLKASYIDKETGEKIVRVITRHTPTSYIPPESIEEKIVYDADTLDRFGWIGILRGIMGKAGSIEDIIEKVIAKRSEDYELLIFKQSKEIGKVAHESSLFFLNELRKALKKRSKEIRELLLPGEP